MNKFVEFLSWLVMTGVFGCLIFWGLQYFIAPTTAVLDTRLSTLENQVKDIQHIIEVED